MEQLWQKRGDGMEGGTSYEENHTPELIKAAIRAREGAYCPYSGFAVGAALRAKDGSVFTGCNIENASFSPSCCAERVAFFSAVSSGATDFEQIVVVGGKKGEDMVETTPCGVCLQVMLEFCDPDTFEVVSVRATGEYEVRRLTELLPYGFRL